MTQFGACFSADTPDQSISLVYAHECSWFTHTFPNSANKIGAERETWRKTQQWLSISPFHETMKHNGNILSYNTQQWVSTVDKQHFVLNVSQWMNHLWCTRTNKTPQWQLSAFHPRHWTFILQHFYLDSHILLFCFSSITLWSLQFLLRPR